MFALEIYKNKIIQIIKKHFFSNSFAKNVLTLMTGTTIAQAISIFISPFLRRVYSPQEFGILALYLSLSSLLSVIVTGRYPVAITLPKSKKDALSLSLACIGFSFIISALSYVIIFIFSRKIADVLGNSEITIWLYIIPVKSFVSGIYQTLNYWFIRMGSYQKISLGKIIQGLTTTILNIGMGLAGFGVVGLILGILVGEMITVVFLGMKFLDQELKNIKNTEWKNIKVQVKRYRKFPIYSLPADLINTIASEMPNLLLSNFFGVTVIGFLSLTQRTLLTPSSLISNSVLDVFKERASSDYRIEGDCRSIYKSTFKGLLLLSFIPFLLLFLFSPQIFSFVFGATWKQSGEYTQILSPFFFLGFIVSPLSYMFYIAERQLEDLILHIYMGVSTLAVLYGSFVFFHDINYVLAAYSINYSLIYLYYLGRSFYFSKGVKGF